MIMDDEEAIRKGISRLLKRLGYAVEVAAEGTEALDQYVKAKAEGQPFTALIMDLTIRGGMGGTETIKRLLAIDPQVKAIVSSGYSSDEVMSEYAEYGFKARVAKPFRFEELARVLQEVIAAP